MEFNPDREWQGNEIWGSGWENEENGKFHGSNPNSARFSPFTFTPRDCLGKNFAQMVSIVSKKYIVSTNHENIY